LAIESVPKETAWIIPELVSYVASSIEIPSLATRFPL